MRSQDLEPWVLNPWTPPMANKRPKGLLLAIAREGGKTPSVFGWCWRRVLDEVRMYFEQRLTLSLRTESDVIEFCQSHIPP